LLIRQRHKHLDPLGLAFRCCLHSRLPFDISYHVSFAGIGPKLQRRPTQRFFLSRILEFMNSSSVWFRVRRRPCGRRCAGPRPCAPG
jgi:hypothetical protein